MTEFYRFAAFISYSSKDRTFAQKLHSRLESYSIPSQLGEFDLIGDGTKNRVYPVFRDREELSVGTLDENLKAALRASANLIVICTPDAAQSQWVSEEIKYFASLGRADRIFTIIAPGKTTDGLSSESLFPSPLLQDDQSPIAADARNSGDGWHNAFLKLVAGIIGVNAGALQDREKRRRQTRRLGWVGGVITTTLIAGFFVWGFLLPQYTYSKNYTRVFGKLTPVDVISRSIAEARSETFRFKQNGYFGRVSLLEKVNSAGACFESKDNFFSLTGDKFEFSCNTTRACAIRQIYEGSDISGEEVLDQAGNTLERVLYTNAGDQAIREEAVVGCSRVDNGIKFVAIKRGADDHDNGLDLEHTFFAAPGEPHANGQLEYGRRISYDRSGRVLRRTSLDAEGIPKLNKTGASIAAFNYSKSGDLIEELKLDTAGQLTDETPASARTVFEYDDAGNILMTYKFRANGSANIDDGYHARRYTYSDDGYQNSEVYLDASLAPAALAKGLSKVILSRDKRGYVNRWQRFGIVENDPVGHCADTRVTNDEFGITLKSSCYDLSGNPSLFEDGYHSTIQDIDSSFNVIRAAYFGPDGGPTVNEGGAHAIETKWNDLGQRVSVKFIGPDLLPSIGADGAHEWRLEYDADGHHIATSFFDSDGRPTLSTNSHHRLDITVDEYGRRIKFAPTGIEGQALFITELSYAVEYDDFDNITKYSTLNETGEIDNASGGFASDLREYDHRGNFIRVVFTDKFGGRVRGWNGAFEIKNKYDNHDRLIERGYRDQNGNPMLGSLGAAYQLRSFDDFGHLITREWFGLSNEPVNNAFGAHKQVQKYDQIGRLVEVRYLDLDGNPVAHKQRGLFGWKYVHDDRGNRIETRYIDANDNPMPETGSKIAIFRNKYDRMNRQTEVRYFDANNKPIANVFGVYGRSYIYDSFNRITRSTNLGRDGNPMAAETTGEAYEERRYDGRGNVVERRYYKTDGTLVTAERAIARYKLDRFGNELTAYFLDASENPFASAISGRAIVSSTYDALGNVLTQQSFDASEQPVNRLDLGWFQKVYTRTPSGALLSALCYTTEDVEVPCDP